MKTTTTTWQMRIMGCCKRYVRHHMAAYTEADFTSRNGMRS